MLAQAGLYLVIVTLIYLNLSNLVSTAPTDIEEQAQKRSLASLLGRFGMNSGYFSSNYPLLNDGVDKDAVPNTKREMKRKWAKFFQGSQSPYAIAFPALIRTRRWIEEEEQ